MKPFNLKQAKAGKPVCTRGSSPTRIICFDKKGTYPIVALVESEGTEVAYTFFSKERIGQSIEWKNDLMMTSVKKEGWINIYRGKHWQWISDVYESKEEALKRKGEECIDTIKIEYNE